MCYYLVQKWGQLLYNRKRMSYKVGAVFLNRKRWAQYSYTETAEPKLRWGHYYSREVKIDKCAFHHKPDAKREAVPKRTNSGLEPQFAKKRLKS